MARKKIISHKTRAMPTKPEERGSGQEIYVLPPPHRTKQEIIDKQVMDRMLGKKQCVLGTCYAGKMPLMYSGPLTNDDRDYVLKGICPRCGFPSTDLIFNWI